MASWPLSTRWNISHINFPCQTTIPSRIEHQYSDLCRQSLTPEQELALLYLQHAAAMQQSIFFLLLKKKKENKVSAFHFPARERTLLIVLPGVSGRARGILPGISPLPCTPPARVFETFVAHEYEKTSLLWPGLYHSCHLPFLFILPLSSLSHMKCTRASHTWRNTKFHQTSFFLLPQTCSFRKNNRENASIHKWHYNKVSLKSL